MRRPILIILSILLALAAIESLAWWWMNPPPTGSGEPVLAYRPGVKAENLKAETLKEEAPAPAHDPALGKSSTDHRSLITDHSSSPFQPLPEIYRQAAPMLRCSTGEVFRIDTADHLTLHLAFFEWNDTDTGSVLEAFRHMPEACMGSIGLKLVAKEKPIRYTVRSQGAGDRDQESEVRVQEEDTAQGISSTDNRQPTTDNSPTPHALGDKSAGCVNPALPSRSTIHNLSRQSAAATDHQSSISPSSTDHSLLFDHTVFEDPASASPGLRPRIHSFRAVWVSGMNEADARRGIDGHELDRLRTIRLKAAATRYRPTHARVIQGTIRGAFNATTAWQAFEHHMLRHLAFAR